MAVKKFHDICPCLQNYLKIIVRGFAKIFTYFTGHFTKKQLMYLAGRSNYLVFRKNGSQQRFPTKLFGWHQVSLVNRILKLKYQLQRLMHIGKLYCFVIGRLSQLATKLVSNLTSYQQNQFQLNKLPTKLALIKASYQLHYLTIKLVTN